MYTRGYEYVVGRNLTIPVASRTSRGLTLHSESQHSISSCFHSVNIVFHSRIQGKGIQLRARLRSGSYVESFSLYEISGMARGISLLDWHGRWSL